MQSPHTKSEPALLSRTAKDNGGFSSRHASGRRMTVLPRTREVFGPPRPPTAARDHPVMVPAVATATSLPSDQEGYVDRVERRDQIAMPTRPTLAVPPRGQ